MVGVPIESTGARRADTVVAAFERAFPGRVRACYALGSYADATALVTSDLDLTLVFKGAFDSDDEREHALLVARDCAQAAEIELDIEIDDEETLERGVSPNLKLASALIWGEDIRDRLTLVSLAAWTRDRMHTSWWRIARLFGRPAIITPPLEYPDREAPFWGYVRRSVRLPDGREVSSTRDLIRLAGWAATALLALDRGVYVARKRDAHIAYHHHIGSPWDSYFTDMYEICRSRWSYLVPEDARGHSELRALCERTLLFERYFLERYNTYLINELHAGGERTIAACEALKHAPLAVHPVMGELHLLSETGEAASREHARAALAAYQLF